MTPHIIFILFFFALGACIGSFLNVVAWRLPRDESLIRPPSHCPKCLHPLAWFDNFPVFGWILLRGKCRYCGQAISARYPIIEAITGLLFVFYYVAFFLFQHGPCNPTTEPITIQQHWPIYVLEMFLISALLAASLIDAELFIVPQSICLWMAGVGMVTHAIFDTPIFPGSVIPSAPAAALALGAGIGLLISILLVRANILPISFAEGTPELEIDKKLRAESGDADQPLAREYSKKEVRREMRKEMLFLMPPLVLGGLWVALTLKVPALANLWENLISHNWAGGLLGALLGGLVGGFTVWFARIAGSLCFGREAMGLGDADLMFGVGCVLGPGPAVIAFFLAPFCGIGMAIYKLIFRTGRELPYVPFLSMGTAVAMVFYCPIAGYFAPGLFFLCERMREWIAGG